MKPRKVQTVCGLGLLVALGSVASAQAQVNPRQQVSQRFETTAPAVGTPFPAVVVYDAGGKKLRVNELLQGHYTVIVLGCLT